MTPDERGGFSRHVLITGATGVLGCALPPAFSTNARTRISVLLRPKDGRSVEERGARLKAYWLQTGVSAEALNRVRVVPGDAARENLGLSPSDHEILSRTVTHVVHAAGRAEVGLSAREARAACVDTTQQVLIFCRTASSLQKMEFLSTVGVMGLCKGVLPEGRFRVPRAFQTPYEAAKAEAEERVWAAAGEFPVTVHRPTFVVGDSAGGRVLRYQVFYGVMEFLSGRATRGWTARFPPVFLDAVPVDFVARTVAASADHPQWAGRVLHLVSRPAGAWSARDYGDRLPGLFQALGGAVPRRHLIPWGLFCRAVPWMAWGAPPRLRPLLRVLGDFLKDLDTSRAATSGVETTETLRVLGTAGIDLPAVEEWIRPVLAYYLSTPPGGALP